MKRVMILTRERSEEEKLRRHLFGDKGAKFSGGKVPRLAPPGNRDNNHIHHERYAPF
jgi:hypothetical protein